MTGAVADLLRVGGCRRADHGCFHDCFHGDWMDAPAFSQAVKSHVPRLECRHTAFQPGGREPPAFLRNDRKAGAVSGRIVGALFPELWPVAGAVPGDVAVQTVRAVIPRVRGRNRLQSHHHTDWPQVAVLENHHHADRCRNHRPAGRFQNRHPAEFQNDGGAKAVSKLIFLVHLIFSRDCSECRFRNHRPDHR